MLTSLIGLEHSTVKLIIACFLPSLPFYIVSWWQWLWTVCVGWWPRLLSLHWPDQRLHHSGCAEHSQVGVHCKEKISFSVPLPVSSHTLCLYAGYTMGVLSYCRLAKVTQMSSGASYTSLIETRYVHVVWGVGSVVRLWAWAYGLRTYKHGDMSWPTILSLQYISASWDGTVRIWKSCQPQGVFNMALQLHQYILPWFIYLRTDVHNYACFYAVR